MDELGRPPGATTRLDGVPRRPFVPDALREKPFTVQQAARLGVSRRALDGRSWRRLLRGVFVHVEVPDTPQLRADAVALVLPPGSAVAGRTAAWMYGAWMPRPGTALPLEVVQSAAAPGHRVDGVPTLRHVLDPVDLNELRGVPITSPERTCFELMRGRPLPEAVVVADSFLHVEVVTARGLMRYADERPHWPGVRRIRAAVDLSNPGSASPMETRLRMVIVLAGLPEPAVNVPVHDAGWRFLGRPDLFYFDPGFGIEYDGSYHGDLDTHRHDLHRENRLLAAGIPLLRYTAGDVYRGQDRIVREVAALLGPRRAWSA